LKKVFSELDLYDGNINGYFTDDFVDAVYNFQLSQGIVSSPYEPWAWFWWERTRAAFFKKYLQVSYPVFRPNDIISKSEAIKILMKMSGIQSANTAQFSYTDITVGWHMPYIRTWETLWLFDPIKDNWLFHPNDGVTREDMVYLIQRLVSFY